MSTSSAFLFLHAQTGLHPGSGETFGAIDLAIQRERYTRYPLIAASGVKGALRHWFETRPDAPEDHAARVAAVFGPDKIQKPEDAHAGAVAFTDAQLLLFPIRSARGVFVWATSPLALARFHRDLDTMPGLSAPPHVEPPENLAEGRLPNARVASANAVALDGEVLLEEYPYHAHEDPDVARLAEWLAERVLPQGEAHAFWRTRLQTHLVVLPDDAFSRFVQTSTEVQARVRLNDKKTTTGGDGNLFYQENLPADTLLVAGLHAVRDRSPQKLGDAAAMLNELAPLDGHRVQIGGDETIGKGICAARLLRP